MEYVLAFVGLFVLNYFVLSCLVALCTDFRPWPFFRRKW